VLLATAGRLNTPKRKRYASAIISLGLCLGPSGVEAALVRPADVLTDDGTVSALLRKSASEPGRRVVANSAYADLLLEAVAQATKAGDTFLIGGWGPRTSRVSNVCRDIEAGSWLVPLNLSRLRDNFMVSLMLRAHTIPELLAQAGVGGLEAFNRLLPYLLDVAVTPLSEAALPDAALMAVPE
jgi:hypothetical protein